MAAALEALRNAEQGSAAHAHSAVAQSDDRGPIGVRMEVTQGPSSPQASLALAAAEVTPPQPAIAQPEDQGAAGAGAEAPGLTPRQAKRAAAEATPPPPQSKRAAAEVTPPPRRARKRQKGPEQGPGPGVAKGAAVAVAPQTLEPPTPSAGSAGGELALQAAAHRVRHGEELRGLSLVAIPLPLMRGAGDANEDVAGPSCAAPRRSRRQCMRPLQAWRNERLVYERPAGTPLPLVRGALLNAAGEPGFGGCSGDDLGQA